MKIAALQTDIHWEEPAANFDRLRPQLAAAAAAGARLVVLPEMFAYGFSMNTSAIAETVGGASAQFLTEMARAHDVWICGSAPERASDADRPANTLLLAAPDGQISRYRKIHPFTFAREHEYYTAGDKLVTVNIDTVRTTLFVCYDLRFADEFWATAAATDMYIVVANWPERRREHWRVLLRARAIENQAYVVGVNRVGTGGDIRYAGDSAVVDPWGAVLAEAATDATMLLADVNPKRVADARAQFPVLADRRNSQPQ